MLCYGPGKGNMYRLAICLIPDSRYLFGTSQGVLRAGGEGGHFQISESPPRSNLGTQGFLAEASLHLSPPFLLLDCSSLFFTLDLIVNLLKIKL